jgi:hypothetical protein
MTVSRLRLVLEGPREIDSRIESHEAIGYLWVALPTYIEDTLSDLWVGFLIATPSTYPGGIMKNDKPNNPNVIIMSAKHSEFVTRDKVLERRPS